MPTLERIVADTRMLLDDPIGQHPSQRQLYQLAIQHVQNYMNELSNTGVQWNIFSTVIHAAPETKEYLISAPDFGKPIFVLTEDASDPIFSPREIEIVDIPNVEYYTTRAAGAPYITTRHGAVCISFYQKYGSAQGRYCQLSPTPSEACDYRIWYEVGQYSPGGPGDELILPEHHHLLANRLALAALPYAKWDKLDIAQNADRRAELANTLKMDAQRYEEAWERYITNSRQETMTSAQLFGGDDTEGWY